MFRTLVNEAYTSEESRDCCSDFVVTRNYQPNAFGRCSQIEIFLFQTNYKNGQGKILWANRKLRN